MAQEPTNGEIYRLCLDIRADVKTQNGRVAALEKDAIRIKTMWTGAVLVLGFFSDYIRHKIGLS